MCVSLSFFLFLFSSQSEREEFEAEYKEKYERERILLTDENKKLSSELDKVKYFFRCRTKNHYENTHSLKQVSSVLLSQLFNDLLISQTHTHTRKKETQFPNPR